MRAVPANKVSRSDPAMTQQHRVAVAVMLVLIGAAFVQAIVMCAEVGLSNGWLLIRNDPGKFIFHLLLLPVSFGALVWSFPTGMLRRCLQGSAITRYVTSLVGVALLGLAIAVGLQEAVDGFKERIPVPTDVRSVVTQQGLNHAARDELLGCWLALHDPAWVPASGSSSGPGSSQQRSDAYNRALQKALGSQRDFWTQASIGAWWSALLSALGVSLASAWLFTIIIVALQHRSLDEPTTAALVVAFGIGLASIALWFYFKMYSEWYINFYAIQTKALAPIIMALLSTVVLALIAVVVRHAQQPLTWFGRMAAVSGFATGVAAYWRPDILRMVADAYRGANDSSVAGLWTVAAVGAFLAAYLTAVAQDSSPHDARSSLGERVP